MEDLTQVGLLAGRYVLGRVLGRGATKTVYLADDRLSGVQVALALLRPDVSESRDWLARFQREARIGAVLASPYVVRVFDYGTLEDGTFYVSTEAILGRGMDDALAHGAVSPELAVRWTCQVLGALEEVHSAGVVHRDIKPENVLLARTSTGEIAKLTDFGIAKLLDGSLEAQPTVRTAANVVLGTPHYMSPEQWSGGRLDGRADVYSVSAMLYELLVGETPFEDVRDIESLAGAHIGREVPHFSDEAPAAVRALEPIVRRGLAKRAVDRFVSAASMRGAIEECSGFALASEPRVYEPALPATFSRVELASEIWPAPIQLIAAPQVVLGRDRDAHVAVRCLPATEENERRSKTISRRHARLAWHGGRATIADLGSRFGTRVNASPVDAEPLALADGDEIAVGPHARLNFQHALCRAGELPRWGRLIRTDEWGFGQLHVLILTEARLSADEASSVPIPAWLAGDSVVRIRVGAQGLSILESRGGAARPITDSAKFNVGSLEVSVTLHGDSAGIGLEADA